MTEPSLLLLIPAYNEERRIEPVLRDYARYFQQHYRGDFQLVVVLNGCRDNTLAVVQRVARDFPLIGVLEFKEPIDYQVLSRKQIKQTMAAPLPRTAHPR